MQSAALDKPLCHSSYHDSALSQTIANILQAFRHAVDTPSKPSDAEYHQHLQQALAALIPLSNQIAYPAQGHTLQRWQVLAQVAACDLNLVKFFESHLDALAILAELGVDEVADGLWAVWAAEGGNDPLRFDGKTCHGQKLWCSGAAFVDNGLVSFLDANNLSQLLMVPMDQSQITLTEGDWHAVGMPYTATATVTFAGADAKQVIADNIAPDNSAYLDRAGFWQGAAGVAACWYGAAAQLASFLLQSYQQKPHAFKAMYLGGISQALSVTRAYFYHVAQLIDSEPTQSHTLPIRILRAQVEATAMLVLEKVGKALGATPYCKNAHFARLSADLAVFIRQTHGAFDSEALGKLTAMSDLQGGLWQL